MTLGRKARKVVENNPTPANKTNYNKLTAKVRYLTRTGKRKRWHETCQQLDLNREGHKTWKLLSNLEGNKSKENPKPFNHEGQKVISGKKKADIFNKFLAWGADPQGGKTLIKPCGDFSSKNKVHQQAVTYLLRKTSPCGNSMQQSRNLPQRKHLALIRSTTR